MSLFKLKEVAELQPLVGEFFHTGSRVICNPPPQDTDDDYIVLVGQGAIQYVQKTLDQTGWKLGGSFDPRTNKLANSPEFVSYKKDEYNLILTTNQDYFESFKRATYLASHLNLLKKEDRVTLFEAIVRDNYPTKLKSHGKTLKDWATYYFAGNVDGAPNLVQIPLGGIHIEAEQPGNPVLDDMAREARIALEDAQIEEMFGHPNAELDEEIGAFEIELEEAGLEAE